ncbi:hypothetical protein V6Z11_A06G152000 [Gossypium hirsutum]
MFCLISFRFHTIVDSGFKAKTLSLQELRHTKGIHRIKLQEVAGA